MNKALRGKKVGLALGSGSARGWAHIGVIEALEELGITVDYVAGTSIGSLVGAFYAAKKLDSIKRLSLELDWKQIISFLDVVLPKSGLIDGNKVKEFISESVGLINIEDLKTPFKCIATDLVTAREVVIGSGDIIEAVRSSISVPGIFTPVIKGKMLLVDGGLVNPVPVSVLKEMGAEFIIAVDLNHDIHEKRRPINIPNDKTGDRDIDAGRSNGKDSLWSILNKDISELELSLPSQFEKWFARDDMPSIFEVMMKSFDILEIQVTTTRLKLDPPDIIIRPPLGSIKFIEFDRASEAIDAGYRETMKVLKG